MRNDLLHIEEDFPLLNQSLRGKKYIYFDNAATTQKPTRVLNKINEIYTKTNANIHRGVHFLSDRMTEEYEEARETIKNFINAENKREIIFTSGATDSINLIAYSFGEKYIKEGDEIIVTELEHHANIVPWQQLCIRKSANLKVIPIDRFGNLKFAENKKLITSKTKIIAVAHISNVLGLVNPIEEIIKEAHKQHIPVLIDGSQSIQHIPIDVQKMDCDFFVFSGHKIYGPTGIGVLYGKEKYLNDMPPFRFGGDMVDKVSFEKTTFNVLPFKFEAGTSNYIGAIGLAEAIRYLEEIGLDTINKIEKELVEYTNRRLNEISDLTILGSSNKKTPIFSFSIENIHSYDIGVLLDNMAIAVRTGTHCAQPLMQRLELNGTVRASLAFYNTKEEIDIFIDGLKKAIEMLT